MGKKMKLPFSFSISSYAKSYSLSWPWPSCSVVPRTLSFRISDDTYKTMNSAYVDISIETPQDSWFTNSSESPCLSNDQSEDQISGADQVEKVIKGLNSDRLFFKPEETNSILEDAKKVDHSSETMPLQENTMFLTMDSQDPQVDFKNSMEEMVEAHGLKNWKCLEELLFWYLRVNEKSNHNYIVRAYTDLLVGLSFDSSSSTSCPHFHSPSSPLLFYTSSSSSLSTTYVSSLEVEDEEEDSDLSSSLAVEKKIIEVLNDGS